ncbi:MAG: hypothetical protein R3C28_11260 [Pirellulaceae bacterium]
MKVGEHDYHLHFVELQKHRAEHDDECSPRSSRFVPLDAKATAVAVVVLGNMSLGGNITRVENLADFVNACTTPEPNELVTNGQRRRYSNDSGRIAPYPTSLPAHMQRGFQGVRG